MAKKSDPTLDMVRDLKMGIESPFWKILKKAVVEEKEDIEEQIFGNEGLSDKQRDDLRRWRNFLVYFMELPEKMIEAAVPPQAQEEPDFEVYDTPKTPLREITERITG